MNEEQRRSIGNGIWLCAVCSRKIDADASAYPTPALHSWRHEAEARARREQGTRLPRNEDAVDTLTAALSGHSARFTRTAIANVHAATEKNLNGLDPRFFVETQYVNRVPSYTIHARKDTDLKFHVPGEIAPAWVMGLGEAMKHGVEVVLPADGLMISGSPLFEQLMHPSDTKGATLTVGGPKKEAMVHVDLRKVDSGEIRPFRDLQGAITFGTESFSFDGRACAGMFAMAFRLQWTDMVGTQSFTFGSDFKEWHGKDVRALPHFDTLYELYRCMDEGWSIGITLEIDGLPALRGITSKDTAQDAIKDARLLFDHVSRVREIAAFTDQAIHYSSDQPLSYEERLKVAEAAATMKGERVYTRGGLSDDPTTTIVVCDDGTGLRSLLNSETSTAVRLEWPEEEISIFGSLVLLPRLEIFFENVLPRPLQDLQAVRCGDEVEVVWHRTENFKCEFRYMKVQAEATADGQIQTDPAAIHRPVTR